MNNDTRAYKLAMAIKTVAKRRDPSAGQDMKKCLILAPPDDPEVLALIR